MGNLTKYNLEQIAKMRWIKNYKNMARENLLIALLKSKQSHAELRRSKDSNTEIEETKKNFNELRNDLSKEEIKRIRRKFRYREWIESNGRRKTRLKILYQKIKKGWKVLKKLKRRFKEIRKASIQW